MVKLENLRMYEDKPMQKMHAELGAKRADWEFERRFNLVGVAVFLSALPLVVYVALAYLQRGFFHAPGLSAALLVYLFVVYASSALARRAIATTLKAEGLAPESYRPPKF